MRLVAILGLGMTAVYAQTCAPAPILPGGQASGSLNATSCSLSDGTPYDVYRLVVPGRGQLQVTLNAPPAAVALILQDATGAQIAAGASSLQRQVEAGNYTVLVNGQTPAAQWNGPAAYTLQTSFTPEPGTWCSVFPAIGLSQHVNGTLGGAGCRTPDGTPYDAWALTTLGAGSLMVSVSSTDFTPLLIVRGEDGGALATDPASVSVPVTASANYQVVVATSDNRGAYQVTTSFTPADGETCVPQKTLTGTDSDSASVTPASCSVVMDSIGDLAYFNYYNLTVSSAGLADIAVTSTDFTPTLYLLDTAGNILAIDSGGTGGAYSGIRYPLAPGNYTVEVFSNFPSGGGYKLNSRFTPGPPQGCVPLAYNPGAAQPGMLSPSSCRTSIGLGDIYSLTLPASGVLTVDLSSNDFTTQVAIRDAKDNLIVMNQDIEGVGASHLRATLPAGSYTLLASANAGSGSYQLNSQFTSQTITPCTQGQPIVLNYFIDWTLAAGGCVGSNGQPTDLYQFTMPSPGVAAAVVTSADLNGYLTLTDANGNVLRTDQNSYSSNDPFIVQYLPAGSYQLAVRDATNTSGALYRMTLLGSLGPRPVFCGTLAPLAIGGSIDGALGISSCQYVDNTFADLYQVTLSSATTIDLRMTSNDFDAYLMVLDGKGNVVASDDDSGGGANARIVQPLQPGTYYVLAKQFGNYYPAGAYTISLSVAQASTPAVSAVQPMRD